MNLHHSCGHFGQHIEKRRREDRYSGTMIQLCNRRVGGVDVQGGGGGCSSIRSMRGAKKGKRARRTCVKGYARWQGGLKTLA